jgi:hypothetical protein
VRDTPPALRAFFASGERLSAGTVDAGRDRQPVRHADNGLLQRIDRMPRTSPGRSPAARRGTIGEGRLGVIATGGTGNKWRTRDNTQQTPANADLSLVDKDYREVVSENRIVNNALVGLAYEFGEGNRVRWTNLYIHDTLKRGACRGPAEQPAHRPGLPRAGHRLVRAPAAEHPVERHLQVRSREPRRACGAYARRGARRRSRRNIGYARSNQAASPFGAFFLNRLDNGQTGFARVGVLRPRRERCWSAGRRRLRRTAGPALVLTGASTSPTRSATPRGASSRSSRRRAFPTRSRCSGPTTCSAPAVIDFYNIGLIETTEVDPAFAAKLRTSAGYLQVHGELAEGLELNAGARFERASRTCGPTGVQHPDQLRRVDPPRGGLRPAGRDADLQVPRHMQVRLQRVATIARPQFRELMFQTYFDPESNRSYRGNPLLVDSEFTNAEARYEWYFAPEQRFSVAGFYKQIDRPIEAFTGFNDNTTGDQLRQCAGGDAVRRRDRRCRSTSGSRSSRASASSPRARPW